MSIGTGLSLTQIAARQRLAGIIASNLSIDPVVKLSAGVYTFTVRRDGSGTQAETRSYALAGSANYPPAATQSDFGGSFPSGTVTFSAGSLTAPLTVSAASTIQPE